VRRAASSGFEPTGYACVDPASLRLFALSQRRGRSAATTSTMTVSHAIPAFVQCSVAGCLLVWCRSDPCSAVLCALCRPLLLVSGRAASTCGLSLRGSMSMPATWSAVVQDAVRAVLGHPQFGDPGVPARLILRCSLVSCPRLLTAVSPLGFPLLLCFLRRSATGCTTGSFTARKSASPPPTGVSLSVRLPPASALARVSTDSFLVFVCCCVLLLAVDFIYPISVSGVCLVHRSGSHFRVALSIDRGLTFVLLVAAAQYGACKLMDSRPDCHTP
jgi:hypothetical protein